MFKVIYCVSELPAGNVTVVSVNPSKSSAVAVPLSYPTLTIVGLDWLAPFIVTPNIILESSPSLTELFATWN